MNEATSSNLVVPTKTAGYKGALRRFALAITVLTIVGHGYLGFEQSMAQPLVALAVAYFMQLLVEWIFAKTNGLTPRFYGGVGKFVDFLLPAHISALAIAMLLYYNEALWIVAFATAVAIGSKTIFRVPVANGSRHIFNPSNLGITFTLILFPSVGLTMPWQWTTEISGIADWLFPVLIFVLGTMLHLKHADRIWVVIAFLISFLIQALFRGLFFADQNLLTTLVPATGVAAAIFTFYMAPDPATSPAGKKEQIMFGASIGLVYMILMFLHVVFALFYALTIVCLVRGIWMASQTVLARHGAAPREIVDDQGVPAGAT